MNICDKCGSETANAENEYAEFICDDCEQNAAERAWERHCISDYDLRQQQINALKFK